MEAVYRDEGRWSPLGTGEMMRRRMGEKQGKRQTGNDRSPTHGRVVLVETDLEGLLACVALHFGNTRSNFHGDVGDGVDGGVRRVGQRGIGVHGWFMWRPIVVGTGAIVAASSIARVTSHGIREGQRKGGMAKRQGRRRIDFKRLTGRDKLTGEDGQLRYLPAGASSEVAVEPSPSTCCEQWHGPGETLLDFWLETGRAPFSPSPSHRVSIAPTRCVGDDFPRAAAKK